MQKQEKNVNKTAPEKERFHFSRLWKDKRLRAIVIALAVVILAGIAYLILSLTVLKANPKEDELPTIGRHGETMINGKPFVVEPLESDQITGIRVENARGGFYYYKGSDGQFYFDGAETMLYDQTSDWMQAEYEDLTDLMESVSMIDGLYGISRYMLASYEVEGFDPDNLAAYGLENGGQATLTVTYEADGSERKNVIHFGYETPSGGSYYAMADGREALYVVSDTTISRCIFTGIESYFTPLVAPDLPNSVYPEVAELSIEKHGEPYFAMRKLDEEEYDESGQLFTHILTYPNEYFPSTENIETLLSKLANFVGKNVVAYNITEKLADPAQHDEVTDLFKLYSLIDRNGKWSTSLYYRYEEGTYDFDITLYISEKLEVAGVDGEEPVYIYYVYSPDFDVIVEFEAADLPWLEWGLLDFIDNHAYVTLIDRVANITLSWGDTVARFDLTGEGNDLKITSPAVKDIDTDNFRQLYKAILFTTMEGYAEEPGDGALLLTVDITLRDGTKHEYTYYGMTARKAYYSLDGSGEFYINRDYVKQMISACQGILNGEKITVDRKI